MDSLNDSNETSAGKKQRLDMRNEEKEELLEGTEIKSLNERLFKLMAEIEVRKTNKCSTTPPCSSTLYSSTVSSLQKDIEHKKKVSISQQKIWEKASQLYNSLIQIHTMDCLCKDAESCICGYEEALEVETLKARLLKSLHRKLSRRLKRTSNWISVHLDSEKADRTLEAESSEGNMKSFNMVLKEFVVELGDRNTTAVDWRNSRFVQVDESFSDDHIAFLKLCKIIKDS